MANAIAKIPVSLPATLATMFIWCLLIIVYGPLENGAGVAAWTNDVMPKLKLKFGKRYGAAVDLYLQSSHLRPTQFIHGDNFFFIHFRTRKTIGIFRQSIGLFSNSRPRRSFVIDWCKVIIICSINYTKRSV